MPKFWKPPRADFEARGYTLEIVEYTDYVQPNIALDGGNLDANYFQHQPYLDEFNASNNTSIVSVGTVHYEPFGIYAGKTASLDELADGATIAVPNDATNEARALLLLEANGLITLSEDAGLTATVLDIEENPHNFEIVELGAAQVSMLPARRGHRRHQRQLCHPGRPEGLRRAGHRRQGLPCRHHLCQRAVRQGGQ